MTDIETIISAEPDAPAADKPGDTPGSGKGAPAAAAVDAALHTQIKELKEQAAESERTARYWAERAKATGEPAPAAPAKTDDDEDDDTDVLEAITTGGAKGFDDLAKKRGFVRKADVEQMIDSKVEARATTLVKEQELVDRYPDLKKKDSEFFQTTAQHYGTLIKSGTPQVLAMEIAAEKAELDFMRSGKLKSAPDREKDARETERVSRIRAQAGGNGRRPSAPEDETDELTPEQKRIVNGMGISPEAYIKRAKAGVRMGGKTPR